MSLQCLGRATCLGEGSLLVDEGDLRWCWFFVSRSESKALCGEWIFHFRSTFSKHFLEAYYWNKKKALRLNFSLLDKSSLDCVWQAVGVEHVSLHSSLASYFCRFLWFRISSNDHERRHMYSVHFVGMIVLMSDSVQYESWRRCLTAEWLIALHDSCQN